jgi:hypothetical protein
MLVLNTFSHSRGISGTGVCGGFYPVCLLLHLSIRPDTLRSIMTALRLILA